MAGALLLAAVVADSTGRADWVAGAVALPFLAIAGALIGCGAGLSRIRGATALVLTAAPAPLAAFVAVSGGEHRGLPLDWRILPTWWAELLDGRAATDATILLLLLYALFWLLGAWLAWGLVRRRQPLLAVAPAGAALATNVLNFPDGQDAYVFWFVVLTLALLLWSTYQSALAGARRRRVELAAGARWEFWERGALAAAGLVAVGVLIPPLTVTDRTADVQNGLTEAWSRVAHATGVADTSVGFSPDARLSGALAQAGGEVFTYRVGDGAVGPTYFRGLNLQPARGEWTFGIAVAATQRVGSGQEVRYRETYQEERRATYTVDMMRPPAAAPDLIVAPGRLANVDREVRASQSHVPGDLFVSPDQLDAVDQVTSAAARGSYVVEVAQSIASVDELRAAGTDYPEWIDPYLTLPPDYRPAATEKRIRELAVQVTARARNRYDQAAAVEDYLRTRYAYTLTPGAPAAGVDPEEHFLFDTHAGYCQYFATAMADMLRSIGVPVRLVNGYGPGTYEQARGRYAVSESDAHTWPEVYFPTYGWIPFEPTPDGVYQPIPRGGAAAAVPCGDACAPSPAATATPARAAAPTPKPAGTAAPPGARPAALLALPALRTWMPVAAGLLLALVLLFIALSRFLRPQTVAGVWRRATLLLQLAGVQRRVGETPIEFGDRVARRFPETASGMRQLAGDFAVAAYAPPRLAEQRRPAVLAGWGSLCPLLLRRVVSRARRAPTSSA